MVEVDDKPLPELDVEETDTGIDLGLSCYAVLRGRKQAVAKTHARIADRRRDFIEHETTRIVRESQAVYAEDLNVKGMATRGGRLGKSVHDQSLGRFVRTLGAKCARYGRTFVTVDRWFPSTQQCSTPGCGRLTGPGTRTLRPTYAPLDGNVPLKCSTRRSVETPVESTSDLASRGSAR